MKCPACADPLYKVMMSDIELDVCQQGCGGIWFDQFEFKKFDEPHEFVGEAIFDMAFPAKQPVAHDGQRQCSRCDDQLMVRRFYSPRQQIEIDECYICGGVWLDYGELLSIRSKFNTDAERREYVKNEFDKEFGGELREFYQRLSDETEVYNRYANMFRFLYPSWYIPDDQDWGKF